MGRKWGSQWNTQMMDYIMEAGPNTVFKNTLPTISKGFCLVLGAGSETNLVCEYSHDVVGVNISFDELRKSRGSGAYLVLCDAQRLPFRASQFDVIICRSTLHHLSNFNAALTEMNRVLMKDSRIFLHEPGQLNFIAFIGRKLFPTDIHNSSEKPFNPFVLRKTLAKHFRVLKEVDFFLMVHFFPILGKRVNIFRNRHFLRALLLLDNRFCKTFFRDLCWIFIFLLEKTT